MSHEICSIFLQVVAAIYLSSTASLANAESGNAVTVGVTSIMSGDLGLLGKNVVDTVKTYEKHYLRHNIKFIYEDARLSSTDGLRAYQKLISVDKVDMIIGGCSSNGTMAATRLINSSKTPTVTIVTGGENIDRAGPYIFRIGNSDTLNGIQESKNFLSKGLTKIALLTEETEYTQDISKAFRPHFTENGGSIVFDQSFLPEERDFKGLITLIKKRSPQAILMPTQTGTALGIFVKQWSELAGKQIEIHTSFVAAPNPDAHAIAGESIDGVYYMAPEYDGDSAAWKEFLERYKRDHTKDPEIPFHSAGTVDALNLLQEYVERPYRYGYFNFGKHPTIGVRISPVILF